MTSDRVDDENIRSFKQEPKAKFHMSGDTRRYDDDLTKGLLYEVPSKNAFQHETQVNKYKMVDFESPLKPHLASFDTKVKKEAALLRTDPASVARSTVMMSHEKDTNVPTTTSYSSDDDDVEQRPSKAYLFFAMSLFFFIGLMEFSQ